MIETYFYNAILSVEINSIPLRTIYGVGFQFCGVWLYDNLLIPLGLSFVLLALMTLLT